MKDLFDVHCHMVPGVDDGASDLEESLAMLKMEYRDGVRNIIVTPHYRRRMFETPAKKVHEQFQKLQEAAKKEYDKTNVGDIVIGLIFGALIYDTYLRKTGKL